MKELNILTCEVVEDLLPSYVDGLTRNVTNEAIEHHIKDCKECQQSYKRMKSDSQKIYPDEKISVDAFKKIKKKNRANIGIAIIAVVAVIAIGAFLRVYVIGTEQPEGIASCNIKVDGSHLELKANSLNFVTKLNKVSFSEKDGVIALKFKGVKDEKDYNQALSAEYNASQEIKQVRDGNIILWDSGRWISREVSDLYAAKHKYVGDPSANYQSLNAISTAEYYDGFEQSIESEDGYNKLIFKITQTSFDMGELRKEFEYEACMLLATIDNVDEVEFEYITVGATDTICVNKVTAKQLVGMDIKECGESISKLQELYEKLNSKLPNDFRRHDVK